ncbi:MAG: nucleoside triphosphate pyrophosphatase [Planctomycetota bacterium]
MPDPPPLILASTSPRRHALLAGLGVPFEVLDPAVAEPDPAPGVSGPDYAQQMALLKARAAAAQLAAANRPPALILASDTTVDCNGEILGKPADRDDAIRILTALSGTTHVVSSAWCLIDAHGAEAVGVDITRITFRPLERGEIEAYVDTGESFGKAGAYAVQEHGDRFVAHIDGEFSTVVGLPLPVVAELLQARGYRVTLPGRARPTD